MKPFYKKLGMASSFQKSKLLLVIMLLLFSSSIIAAGPYFVTSTSDATGSVSDPTTLRGAIAAAESAGGTNTINIAAGTYTLTSTIKFGDQSATQSFIFVGTSGDGATVISMTTSAGFDRIFNFNYDVRTNKSASFTGITFQNGNLTKNDQSGGGAINCGGQSNTMTFKNCVFKNNKVTLANSTGPVAGGAIQCWGGTLVIDSCTFTGNSGTQQTGGAIHFILVNSANASGSINITKSVFSGNTVSTSGTARGGAIAIFTQTPSSNASSYSFSANITGCTFLNNTSTGLGGAISVDNSFAGGTVAINYNRFVGNTATAQPTTSAVALGNNSGSVLDATNNWWGCNTGSTSCNDKGALYTGGTTAVATFTGDPYLQLNVLNSASSLCAGNTPTITASFLTNSTSTPFAASNLTALVNVPVTFTPTFGTISNAQNVIQTNGTATATYTAGATPGAGSVTAVVDNASVASGTLTINTGTSTTNPTSTTTVCSGANPSFSVTGTGTNLSYQWYKGSGNSSPLSNQISATLGLSNVTTAAAGTYHVVVSGTCGTATSNDATLIVNAAPTISTAPATTTSVCVGSTATFAAAATGTPTPTYQWRKGTTNISGATSATLSITNAALTDAATNYNVVATNTCNSAISSDAILVVNSLPSIATQPSSLTSLACTGNPAVFSVSGGGSGTLSYQWYFGSTALTNLTTATGSIFSGVTTSQLTISNPSSVDNATTYNVKVSSNTGCTPIISNNVALAVTAPNTATATTSGSKSISASNTIISDNNCNLIANVVPSGGANAVSGSVTATVSIAGTVPTYLAKKYVQRHYDISPTTNAVNATATLTLYFTQSDFTNYNTAVNSGVNLPTGPTDNANKANIRISQYHGTGTAPGNYTGSSIDIDPLDNNIVWNATYSRWEITFDVVGFSGFYLSNTNTILPLTLLSFAGTAQNGSTLLQWTTNNEINTSYFEVLKSINGIDFTSVAKLPTTGNGNVGINNYQYKDALGSYPVYYYQLKMVDKDGQYTTSDIVAVNNASISNGYIVKATPNPFKSKILVNITVPTDTQLTFELFDINGKKLLVQNKSVNQGNNIISIDQLNTIVKGTYLLHLFNNNINQTIKLIKVE